MARRRAAGNGAASSARAPTVVGSAAAKDAETHGDRDCPRPRTAVLRDTPPRAPRSSGTRPARRTGPPRRRTRPAPLFEHLGAVCAASRRLSPTRTSTSESAGVGAPTITPSPRLADRRHLEGPDRAAGPGLRGPRRHQVALLLLEGRPRGHAQRERVAAAASAAARAPPRAGPSQLVGWSATARVLSHSAQQDAVVLWC